MSVPHSWGLMMTLCVIVSCGVTSQGWRGDRHTGFVKSEDAAKCLQGRLVIQLGDQYQDQRGVKCFWLLWWSNMLSSFWFRSGFFLFFLVFDAATYRETRDVRCKIQLEIKELGSVFWKTVISSRIWSLYSGTRCPDQKVFGPFIQNAHRVYAKHKGCRNIFVQ